MAENKEKRYIIDNTQLMTEWDWEKNNKEGIFPDSITYGSARKTWWHCALGHTYQMSVDKKTSRGFGCPICSGHRTVPGINDFATHFPEIAKEWHPTKNGYLKPSDISKKNGQKVWWICQYGHEWQATPKDRATDNTGCPLCKSRRLTSFPEQAITYYIKKLYPDTLNRYKDIFNNGMELDIYIPSIHLGIEYDGAAWHNTEDSHRREYEKYTLCKNNNITLIRVKEFTGIEWSDVSDKTYIIKNRKNLNELSHIIQSIIDSIVPSSNTHHSQIDINIPRDENEIKEFLTVVPNSLSVIRADLAEEWHPTKNGNLTPEMFSLNSNDYAWWKCKICGHEWRTTIISRGGKRNSGCPECSKILRGKTFTKSKVEERGSLAQNNPSLAKEWHPLKNGTLTPNDITEKRFKNVWWLCSKCGYEWESSPNNRSKGVGCPCCSGRVPKIGVNDFKTIFPNLAEEWNFDKNFPYTPDMFLPKSGKIFGWKCKSCGYEWNTSIRNRTRGNTCPNCAKEKRKISKPNTN